MLAVRPYCLEVIERPDPFTVSFPGREPSARQEPIRGQDLVRLIRLGRSIKIADEQLSSLMRQHGGPH